MGWANPVVNINGSRIYWPIKGRFTSLNWPTDSDKKKKKTSQPIISFFLFVNLKVAWLVFCFYSLLDVELVFNM